MNKRHKILMPAKIKYVKFASGIMKENGDCNILLLDWFFYR